MPLPPLLFEDDTLLAFDKPSGLSVGAERGKQHSDNLMAMVQEKFGPGVANVHRLDADTSGVLLCAKSKVALDFLSGQFQSKTAIKQHVAMVALQPADRALKDVAALRLGDEGLPESFTIELSLREDEHELGRMRVGKGRDSKECLTEFRVLERFGRFVWLECRPVTGRPHQVRVHLAALGAPVLNDAFYGDPAIKLMLSDLKRGYKGRDEEKPMLTQLALHANELTVKHPTTREPVTFSAPLPREFEIALKYLRKFRAKTRAAR
ncbi:MAG: pseudouridine synthase [Opitutaceae bacterium]